MDRDSANLMSFLDTKSDLWQALSSIVEDERLSLYDVRRISARSICLYVDRAEKIMTSSGVEVFQGATIEDCSRLCRRLMTYLHVEGQRLGLGSDVEIEVSTPGINRALRREEHFINARNQRVKVILREDTSLNSNAVNSSEKVFVGVLEDVDCNGITLVDAAKGSKNSLLFEQIKKAFVDFEF